MSNEIKQVDAGRDVEMWAKISSFDLDPIKVKLMDKEEGLGWTLEQVSQAEKWYRRFLYLSFKYPGRSMVPPKIVDRFWHGHILDTQKYAEDCQVIFGKFLHHFPYLGMRGEEDKILLQNSFNETNSLFQKEFGEAPSFTAFLYSASAATCDSSACDNPPNCGSSCGVDNDRTPTNRERPTLASV